MGVPYRRSSSDEAFEGSEPYPVLLIDEIGVMPKYYRSAICTVVGGSLVEGIGGHNLIEPVLYGSVPIYGPFVEKQRHLKRILSDRAIGFECTKATIASVVLGLNDSLEVLKEQVKKIENIGEDFQKPLQNTFLAVGLDHAIL
jgi:3-deoxy-D-manno-octulosonic-acid transferase